MLFKKIDFIIQVLILIFVVITAIASGKNEIMVNLAAEYFCIGVYQVITALVTLIWISQYSGRIRKLVKFYWLMTVFVIIVFGISFNVKALRDLVYVGFLGIPIAIYYGWLTYQIAYNKASWKTFGAENVEKEEEANLDEKEN